MKKAKSKNKIPRTELEIELTCDKIILQQRVRNLQIHLSAALEGLQETFEKNKLSINQNPS